MLQLILTQTEIVTIENINDLQFFLSVSGIYKVHMQFNLNFCDWLPIAAQKTRLVCYAYKKYDFHNFISLHYNEMNKRKPFNHWLHQFFFRLFLRYSPKIGCYRLPTHRLFYYPFLF